MHPTALSRPRLLRTGPTALTTAVALALFACASTPPSNAQLDQARAAYQQSSIDPVVSRVAQRELQQAGEALGRADAALRAGEPTEQVNHLAYIARQRVAVAEETGRIAQADQAAADAKMQRDRIVLQSRTREAQTAQQQAQTAQQLAEQRQAEALAAQRLAEQREADANAARMQASAAQQQAQSLQQQLQDLQAKQTDRGMVLTLGDVLFDTGAATLKPGAMRTVDQLANFLSQHPTNKVLIEGYTDSVGSESTNLDLSQRRADAVRSALVQRGVPMERIATRGLGEANPVAGNDSAGGRQLNRRVEIVFSDEQGTFK